MDKKQLWLVSVLLLMLKLKRVELGTPTLLVVAGFPKARDGLYEEKKWPEHYYKKIGGANEFGNFLFIYTDSRRHNTWILGFGKTLNETTALHRAPSVDGRPSVNGWSYVYDGTREGKVNGSSEPDLRVVGSNNSKEFMEQMQKDRFVSINTNITDKEFEKQLERGIEDGQGNIICKSPEDNWLLINRVCGGIPYCKSGFDACDYVTVKHNSRRVNITRDDWVAGGGNILEGGEDDVQGVACKNHEDNWLIIDNADFRYCDGVPQCQLEIDELCDYVTVRHNSRSVNITRADWEVGGGTVLGGGGDHEVACTNQDDQWVIINEYDIQYCDGVIHCRLELDELCDYVTVRHNSRSANITRRDWEAGGGSVLGGGGDRGDDHGVACRNYEDKWVITYKDDVHYCDGDSHCKEKEVDEPCDYVTVRHNSKSVNITRRDWNSGGGSVLGGANKGRVACKSKSKGEWTILRKCRGCNQIPDCENECDEDACPIYTSPSFQLPIICCLVVLLLGVLLHLGWNAVTIAAEDNAKEIEALGVIGTQLEEAVDLVIQAAIDNSEFPEASYETIHNCSGGINLLIGKYHV